MAAPAVRLVSGKVDLFLSSSELDVFGAKMFVIFVLSLAVVFASFRAFATTDGWIFCPVSFIVIPVIGSQVLGGSGGVWSQG